MSKGKAQLKTGGICAIQTRKRSGQRHLTALGLDTPYAYQDWCREQGFGEALHKTRRQRQRELRRAKCLAACKDAERIQTRHWQQLGFHHAGEYANWCAENGFDASEPASDSRRSRECRVRQQEFADRALMFARQRYDTPQARIIALHNCRSETPRTHWEGRIQLLLERALTRSPKARAALCDLLLAACRYPAILTLEPVVLGANVGNTLPDALLQLALRYREWQRPLGEWRPRERRARDLFGSLVRHLLAQYPVPTFLDAAWFAGDSAESRRYQEWFVHIGKGGNIRTAQNLPLPLTSMAAHHFLRAPRELSILEAMRWGQVMGMGGSRRLAHAVAASRLREVMVEEDFWVTVLRFFVNHQAALETRHVGPMVDFIHHQRYEPKVVVNADGVEISMEPPNANFSMKGRTPGALLRQVEEWHRQLADMAKRPAREWQSAGILPLQLTVHSATDGKMTFWTTHELLSSKELEEEGRAMHNCVATYIEDCQQGGSVICSLRVATPHDPTPRRVMTVEICPATRSIVQARGKCNHCASEPRSAPRLKAGMEALRRWAKQEKLTIAPYGW